MTLKEVKELKREIAKIKGKNEILKKAIVRIYKVNKGIYGALGFIIYFLNKALMYL